MTITPQSQLDPHRSREKGASTGDGGAEGGDSDGSREDAAVVRRTISVASLLAGPAPPGRRHGQRLRRDVVMSKKDARHIHPGGRSISTTPTSPLWLHFRWR